MISIRTKFFSAVLLATVLLAFSGCQAIDEANNEGMEKLDASELETTLNTIADVYQSGAFNVQAYGLVDQLDGTGSSECEPFIRKKLVKYIQKQLRSKTSKEANNLINSRNTAVVYIRGVIPELASKGQPFDLQVIPLPNTQTTSLEGGRLYTTDLVVNANVDYSKPVALAKGQIFVDKLSGSTSKSSYFLLGGGEVLKDAPLSLWLKKPNYYAANAIRNRINEKFGPNIANAISPEEIRLNFPSAYINQKDKFINMVRMLYLGTNHGLMQRRINQLADNLANQQNKVSSEIALETIGNLSIETIAPLLKSKDEAVRFHTARCLLNLSDVRGLETLQQILQTQNSPYRLASLRAIGEGAARNDAIRTLNTVLSDRNFEIKFAAYEYLRDLKAFSVTQKSIAGDFFVDSVASTGRDAIFVTRSGTPRIVLFSAPINCNPDIFVKSDDGNIVITGEAGKKYVSLMKKHPTRPTLIGPFSSTYSVSSILRVLGDVPTSKRRGLGVPYPEIIKLIEQMCISRMIDADFKAGPMAEVKPLTVEPIAEQQQEEIK